MDDGRAFACDISWVLPQLALGGRLCTAAATHMVRRFGVRRIVDLRLEDKDDEVFLRGCGVELLRLPTQDTCAASAKMLDEGVHWVNQQLAAGEAVYVHCEHGPCSCVVCW